MGRIPLWSLILILISIQNMGWSRVITSNTVIHQTNSNTEERSLLPPPEIVVDFTTRIIEVEPGSITQYPIEIQNAGSVPLSIFAEVLCNHNSGYGALFNGGYLNLSEPVITGTEFTIEAWARVDGPGFGEYITNTIFEQRDNDPYDYNAIMMLFARTVAGNTIFTVQGAESTGTLVSTPAPPYGEWHHYAGTVSNEFVSLYIDGQLIGSEPNLEQGGHVNGAENVDIGAHRYRHTLKAGFNGMIDEVRIWDRELSENEISEHQHLSFTTNHHGLVAYWTFNNNDSYQSQIPNLVETIAVQSVTLSTSTAPISEWILLEENSIEVEYGEPQYLNLIVDATYLELGESFIAYLNLETNDPEVQLVRIPLEICAVEISNEVNVITSREILSQNYPNPFYCDLEKRTGTVIEYEVSEGVKTAELIIYNIRGQKVRAFALAAGNRGCVTWDGKNTQNKLTGSGVYCYILKTDGKVSCHRKLLLLK